MTALLDDVTVHRGRRPVLRDVSLMLTPGETLAVVGPNGAGKSTLLRTLGGLLTPRSGRVHVEGRTATVLQDAALARRSVRSNVELALAWWGVPRAERRDRAMAALEQLRAEHLARRPAGALSGGEARRVHLARGLAVGADLLLLDEPFAGLDPEAHERLTLDLATALRATGSTVLVVVHERRDAWALADRIGVLLDGRLAALDTPDRLVAAPPSPEVARFLGFGGELADGDGVLLTREVDLDLIDPGEATGSDLTGRVEQVLRHEHGCRVRVGTERGTVWVATSARPAIGDAVSLRIRGGVRFPAPRLPA